MENQKPVAIEPFGYFKAEPFGWRDCAETDEGAIALYEAPQPQADARDEEREKLLRALYDRGYEDRAKERDYDPLGASEFDAAMCAPRAGAARAKQADALLVRAMAAMKAVESTAAPIDESNGDMDARIPSQEWRDFVDARAALMYDIAHKPASVDALDAARYRYLRDVDWRYSGELEAVIRLQANALWDVKIDEAIAAQTRSQGDSA